MKKLLALSVIGSSLLIGSNPAKADYDVFGYQYSGSSTTGNYIYGINTSTGARTLLTTRRFSDNSINGQPYISTNTGEIVFNTGRGSDKYEAYNWETNTWRFVTIQDPTETVSGDLNMVQRPTAAGGPSDGSIVLSNDGDNELIRVKDNEITAGGDSSATLIKKNTDGTIQLGTDTNDIDVVADGLNIDGSTLITKSSNTISIGQSLRILEDSRKLLMNGNTILKRNSDGTIQIGTDDDDIDITSQGISVGGRPLITRRANGKIHIGKNSLITTEEEETLSDGRKVQPLYAEDGDGNRIPINIDGSKLLIDGVEVTAGGNNAQINTNKTNIKNLGDGVAGSTALTAALTALPQTSKESKLSCGVGTGAYSSRYAVGFGCASKVNERVDINAGGSYVFGGSKSYGEGTLDSGVIKAGFVFKLGELNKLQKISKTEKENLESKIGSLEEKNKQLLARLERLEKVALGDLESKDLAVYKLQ